jgi:hypothetical protein
VLRRFGGFTGMVIRVETPSEAETREESEMKTLPRKVLVALDAFVGLTAVGGGLALAAGLEGDRFPPEYLEGTPFDSYVVPGLILAAAVGGSATVAAIATLRGKEAGGPAAALAELRRVFLPALSCSLRTWARWSQ